MIYLWYPGFLPGTQEIDISKVETPWDDYSQDLSSERDRIMIRNPDWTQNQNKQQNILVRRSMNDTVRTVITNDRTFMDLRFVTLHFSNVRKERRLALEHLLLRAEGHYLGYKDPYGKCSVILMNTEDINIVQDARAGGGIINNPELKKIEDELASIDVSIAIVRTYDSVTING